jgi:hypothetical protein
VGESNRSAGICYVCELCFFHAGMSIHRSVFVCFFGGKYKYNNNVFGLEGIAALDDKRSEHRHNFQPKPNFKHGRGEEYAGRTENERRHIPSVYN